MNHRPNSSSLGWKIMLLSLLATGLVYPALGQNESLSIPRGEPVHGLPAGSDSTQHYSLYIPNSYSASDPPPVLLLMDPRGNARTPLQLYMDVAERYGYVVLSSHETLSDADSAFAVNQRALNAMIRDAQGRFGVDPKRMYLIGFSGTAHFAWYAGVEMDGHVAGVVGVGDGMLGEHPGVRAASHMERPFAYFGMAGLQDFNYDNTWRRDRALDRTPVPHRYAEFEGFHGWMPKPWAERSVEWFELLAMQSGAIPADSAWIQDQFDRRLQDALEAENAGDAGPAARMLREIVQDFSGLLEVNQVRRRLETLEDSREVDRYESRKHEIATDVDDYRRVLYAFVEEFRAARPVLGEKDVADWLQIERLKEQSEGSEPEMAAAASRKLASALAHTGFYEPRRFMERGDPERAGVLLRVALMINPGAGYLCARLARSMEASETPTALPTACRQGGGAPGDGSR